MVTYLLSFIVPEKYFGFGMALDIILIGALIGYIIQAVS